MKRIIAFTLAVSILMATAFDIRALDKDDRAQMESVVSLMKSFRFVDGCELISIGSLGMGFAKMVLKATAESEEEKAAVRLVNGITKLAVLDYSDVPPAKRDSFNAKVARLMDGAEKIMEVKDEGERVDIYGTVADDGQKIKDIMIFVPEDCTIVCFLGSIDSKDLGTLIELSK